MLKKVLLVLILLGTTASLGFSQTDTTKVSLPTPIVRLTIKDLIRGDGYKQEIKLLNEKIILMEQQERVYIDVIVSQDTLITNLETLTEIKDKQINEYKKITQTLENQLAAERLKLRIYNGIGFIVGGIFLISLL